MSSVHSFSQLAVSTPLDPHSEDPVGSKQLEDELLGKEPRSREMGNEVGGARVNLGMKQDPRLSPGLRVASHLPAHSSLFCRTFPFLGWGWGRGAASLTFLTCLSDWELGSSTFNFRDCKVLLGNQKDLPKGQADA